MLPFRRQESDSSVPSERFENRNPDGGTRPTFTQSDTRAHAHSGRLSRFLREMHKALLDEVPLHAWSKVLVVDCRDGWGAEEAWRRLGRGYVCGVDPASEMTKMASRLRAVDGQLEFRVWDRERLPFADGHFDIALWAFGFHRRRDPVGVLREIRRVLRPSGHLYLLEADRMSFGGLFALWDYIYRLVDGRHVRYYSGGEIRRLVEAAGFGEVREMKRYERVLSAGKILATALIFQARNRGDTPGRKSR